MIKPPNPFNNLVASVGLSTTDVAFIAGVTSRAVYHWQSGKTAPPQSLLLLLQAMVQGKVTREWIDDQLATQPPKQENET
jgi:DNA-binding transcriptional regulator YiaG